MKGKILIAGLCVFLSLPVCGQNTTNESVNCSAGSIEKLSSRGITIGAKLDDILNTFASTEDEKAGSAIALQVQKE